MSNGNGGPARTTPVARNRYSEGQILRARDLERDADYFIARDRQHNALAHGPGIITGLQLIAYERGTEKAVQPGSLTAPKELDLMITPGAAIDTIGRLVIVPKRAPLKIEFAQRGGIFAPGTYRVELIYSHKDRQSSSTGSTRMNGCESSSSDAAAGKLIEDYRIELVKYDPTALPPELDRGSVLDGPVDDPTVRAPIVLGLVDWNGTDYVGYSVVGRVYAPVTAERVQAPSEMAELELQDVLGRLAFRTAKLPPPAAQDPFTPIDMTDRFRIDSAGAVWVTSEVSVGPEGIKFRQESDPVSPEPTKWQMGTVTHLTGAEFRKDDTGKLLDPGKYFQGRRELRAIFQRDGTDLGRQRVVIGHVDPTGGDFQPALVVYDVPPNAPGTTGTVTVEIWGDLYVRGTAWLARAERRPPDGVPTNDEFNLLLQQLAGPFAPAFRLFLKSDPEWLTEFAGIMADRVKTDAALRQQFVNEVGPALIGDATFRANLATAMAGNITTLVDAALAAAITDTAKMAPAVGTIAQVLDMNTVPSPLPTDPAAAVVAAVVRRLLRNFPMARDQVFNAMDTPDEEDAVRNLMNGWMPDPPFTAIPP